MEAIVARVGDLQDGELKEVQVGETKVLLSRIKGKFHAVGSVCTHYGGPLAEGVLSGERVYCPWHQSVFNALSGDLEEPPGLDAVPRFPVRLEGDQVVVQVPDEKVERRTPEMCRCNAAADKRTFAILGAGGAGNAAAETLRQAGFQGKILMITREEVLPYDRPLLSKGYLAGEAGAEWLPWRTPEFYREHGIEVMPGREITRMDAAAKTVRFGDGASLNYAAALVATGGVALRLAAPGSDLANVFTLRSPVDADNIIAAASSAKTAVARRQLHRPGNRRQPDQTRPEGHGGGPGGRAHPSHPGAGNRPGPAKGPRGRRGTFRPGRQGGRLQRRRESTARGAGRWRQAPRGPGGHGGGNQTGHRFSPGDRT